MEVPHLSELRLRTSRTESHVMSGLANIEHNMLLILNFSTLDFKSLCPASLVLVTLLELLLGHLGFSTS